MTEKRNRPGAATPERQVENGVLGSPSSNEIVPQETLAVNPYHATIQNFIQKIIQKNLKKLAKTREKGKIWKHIL